MTEIIVTEGHIEPAPSGFPEASGTFRLMSTGLAIIAGFLIASTIWIYAAPLAGSVAAPGFVQVDSHRRALEHRDGGTVTALHVREGDPVRQGQILVELDDSEARAQVAVLEHQADALAARRARLEAERAGHTAIDFPLPLMAHRADARIFRLLQGEADNLMARRQALLGEASLLQSQIAELNDQITGYTIQAAATSRQMSLTDEEIGATRFLLSKSLVPRAHLLELQRQRAALDGQRSNLVGSAERARRTIIETQLKMATLRTNQLKDIADRLRDVASKRAELDPQIIAARDVLERTRLRAPVDGTVVGLTAFTVGGVIEPGQDVLDVVPSHAGLIIEAKAKPEDVVEIAPDQVAEIRLTAFKQRVLPLIRGHITMIAADRQTDERTHADYYEIKAEIDPGDLAGLHNVTLYPGMPADIVIATNPRSTFERVGERIHTGFLEAFREK